MMLERLDRKSGPNAQTVEAEVANLLLTVGERVRAKRKDSGISRRELAERSGVSPRYLAQIESGEGNISIGLLMRVALALDLSIQHLLKTDHSDDAQEARVAALFRNADPQARALVMRVLDPDEQRRQKAERICLIGLRGAGKSTLGAMIARDFDVPFIELNKEIEKSAGVPVSEIIALYGDEGYRQFEADTLDDIIARHERVVLAAAGGIVSDEAAFEKVLTAFHSVWLRALPEEHMDRVRSQGDLRPMAGNPQAMTQLRQILKSREAKYRQAAYHLDTSGKAPEESHRELRELLLSNHLAGDRATF